MNRNLCILFMAVLIMAFLILLSPYIVDQDLFSASDNPLHTNSPAPLYIEKSHRLRSLIDEIGGISEGGALHIKISRLDASRDDIETLVSSISFFEDIVVEVDMEGDELNRTIQKNRAEIDQIWTGLERNAEWNHLKSLELRRTDPEDPDNAIVSTFRGSELGRIVSDPSNLVSVYNGDDDTIISSDAVSRSQSVSLSISLSPVAPTYGDVMVFSGYFSGAVRGYSTVQLFVDSNWEAVGTTDGKGYYSIPFEPGVMPPGGHTAYTSSGGVLSELRKFNVIPHSTILTLGCAETDGAWVCDGLLKSGNRPVDGAGVQILVDSVAVTEIFTDEMGQYSAVLPDASLGSQVQAVFWAGDLPLLGTESPVIQISEDNLFFRIIVLSLIILLPGAGIVYLRRRRYLPVGSVDEDSSQESTEIYEPMDANLRSTDEVSATYQGQAEDDPSGAAFMLFRDLARRLAGRYRIKRPLSLTAREMLAALPEGDLQSIFRRFVPVYEYTRYAGKVTAENMDLLVSEWLSAVRSLMGRDGS